jgi:hypothetical protein
MRGIDIPQRYIVKKIICEGPGENARNPTGKHMAITIGNILRTAGMSASLLLCLGLSACGSSDESSNPATPAAPFLR